MNRGNSLTISASSGGTFRLIRALAAVALLAGCTIERGPPPLADPPLVADTARTPPAPPQPSEPQAWARDLDLHSVPVAADRGQMSEGLIAGDAQAVYSGQRLTFESAFDPAAKPQSEAERMRQRARQRAAEAGLPPPPAVAAAPVAAVEAQALPAEGEAAETPAPRQSRLPPPPEFPPLPSEAADAPSPAAQEALRETAAEAEPEAAPEVSGQSQADVEEAWAKRQSRLPPPPKFPPLAKAEPEPATAVGDAPEASAALLSAAPDDAAVAAVGTGFVAEAWDAPAGTVLVQVSAVSDGGKVVQEWHRLQKLYPQVLQPLRLVVDEAKLGERGVFYRVQAGAFGSPEGAKAACDALIGQGQACFVVVR